MSPPFRGRPGPGASGAAVHNLLLWSHAGVGAEKRVSFSGLCGFHCWCLVVCDGRARLMAPTPWVGPNQGICWWQCCRICGGLWGMSLVGTGWRGKKKKKRGGKEERRGGKGELEHRSTTTTTLSSTPTTPYNFCGHQRWDGSGTVVPCHSCKPLIPPLPHSTWPATRHMRLGLYTLLLHTLINPALGKKGAKKDGCIKENGQKEL